MAETVLERTLYLSTVGRIFGRIFSKIFGRISGRISGRIFGRIFFSIESGPSFPWFWPTLYFLTWNTDVFSISVVSRSVSRHCPRQQFVADQDDGDDCGDCDDDFVADAVYAVVVPDLHFLPHHDESDGNHESCI